VCARVCVHIYAFPIKVILDKYGSAGRSVLRLNLF